MGNMIQTVTGPIKPEQLGRTLMHEHFFFGWPGYRYDASCGKHWTRREVVDTCVEQAKLLLGQGYRTVVDATAADCGRNAEWLKEISEKSGLQIICSTGYFLGEVSATGYWDLRARVSDAEKEIQELMEAELTKGIDGTDIKAGTIKVASGGGSISPYNRRFFVAAAKAQAQTGCVIITHTEDGELGIDEAKLLLENGANPARTVIGHMCGELDPGKHLAIMDLGFNVGFDRIGAYDDHPGDEEKIATFTALIKAGRVERIVMSQDVICKYLGRPFEWPDQEKADWRHYHFGYICDGFLPQLKARGITDEELHQVFVDNPRRIFG